MGRSLSPFQGWPLWLEDPEPRRTTMVRTAVAAVITVLVHSLLLVAVPHLEPGTELQPSQPQEEAFVVELVPPMPDRFVETNPDVAPEAPDNTTHIAAMDQVAAQPDPNGSDGIPTVGGEMADSQKIIEGDMDKTVAEPMPWGTPLAAGEQAAPAENPAQSQEFPDALTGQPVEQEGRLVLPNVPDKTTSSPTEPKPQQESREAEPTTAVEVVMEAVETSSVPEGQPVPQPRPRLRPQVVPGPVMNTPTSAGRMGLLAIDARFSEFGAYQQRMMETISHQWNLLGRSMSYLSADIGTHVVVSFVLHSDGNISDFTILYTTASRAATLLVQDAVMSPAPFGLWTEEMVRILGESQDIRITFYYR